MKTAHTTDTTPTAAVEFPADEPARRIMVLAALRLRGWTLGRIARDIGCTRTAPRTALVRPYPRMECEIARRIGVAPEAIWPERYAARAARSSCRQGGAR